MVRHFLRVIGALTFKHRLGGWEGEEGERREKVGWRGRTTIGSLGFSLSDLKLEGQKRKER